MFVHVGGRLRFLADFLVPLLSSISTFDTRCIREKEVSATSHFFQYWTGRDLHQCQRERHMPARHDVLDALAATLQRGLTRSNARSRYAYEYHSQVAQLSNKDEYHRSVSLRRTNVGGQLNSCDIMQRISVVYSYTPSSTLCLRFD